MNLVAKIAGTEVQPLLRGSKVRLRRPVSSATILLDDADGSLSISALDEIEIRINNELEYSEELDNAVWYTASYGASISADSAADPLHGRTRADKLVEDSSTGFHGTGQATDEAVIPDNSDLVFSAYFKASGRDEARIQLYEKDGSTVHTADFDLDAGTIVNNSVDSAAIEDVGDGWFRVSIVENSGSGANGVSCEIALNNGSGLSYAGDGSSGMLIWGAQLQVGQTTLEDYSPVQDGPHLLAGFVTAIDMAPAGAPPARVLRLECRDWNWRIARPPAAITKAYLDTDDQDIIIDAVTEASLDSDITATTSTIDAISTSLTVGFDGATLRDVLDDMTQTSGGVWWVDGSKTLYYSTAANVTAAPWNIDTDSPDNDATFDVEQLDNESRHDDPLNSVEVVGPEREGERASATASDATSISNIGTYYRKVEVESAVLDSYAQEVADQLVAAGKDSRQSISFKYDDGDRGRFLLRPNHKITVTNSRFGLSSQDFVVREVGITQRAGIESQFSIQAGDFRPTVTDVLAKINAANRSRRSNVQRVRGIEFDPSDSQAVNSGTSIPNLDDMAEFSVLFTIRCDDFSSDRTIVAKEDGSNLGWRIYVTASTGGVILNRTRSSSAFTLRGGIVSTGQVSRMVATYTGAESTSQFFQDGVDVKSGSSTSGSGTPSSEASSPVRAGRDNGGAYFDGMISQIAIWSIALPATTCATLHAKSFDALPFAGDLQLAWKMDEFEDGASATTDVLDRSTNGYDGTPAGSIGVPSGDIVAYIP